MLYADLVHRAGEADSAHRDLERALAIATKAKPSPSLMRADTLCLFGVVEWSNNCPESAALRHKAGVEEGERAGASEEWLRYRCGELASLLLYTRQEPHEALRHATRALDISLRAEPSESTSVFHARLTVGRAKLAVGANEEAELMFRELLEIRLIGHPPAEGVQDKVVTELRQWIAEARKNLGKDPLAP
jgi:hypothetical protein